MSEREVAKALFGEVLDQVPIWRARARALAVTDPLRFFVVIGMTLPEYEAQLDKLEEVGNLINGKNAT